MLHVEETLQAQSRRLNVEVVATIRADLSVMAAVLQVQGSTEFAG